MGYSIATPIKSQKAKDKMFAFLNEHFRRWDEIVAIYGKENGNDYSPDDGHSDPTDDLSYDHGKLRIGFNYGPIDELSRHYYYMILRWMALKVGKKRKWKDLPASVHYIVYDGYEAWPVLVRGEIDPPEKFKWAVGDKLGYKYPRQDMFIKIFVDMVGGKKNYQKLIKDEIKRLDKLWREQ